MPLPRAFTPLRHPAFRMLWIANLASNIGLWVQNTGAGWLMTTLSPSPIMVSLVQAASMLPVFMLAVPAGALADIMDRRTYLLMTQAWLAVVALLLCLLDLSGMLGPWGLLVFTFALGAGLAMSFPGWAATTPELVPREDFVGAIALNGIGFNIARAVGPAIGGVIIASLGTATAFAFNAICILTLAGALLLWKREPTRRQGPREHFLTAIRAGMRFVAATPAMRAAIIRACMFFLFGAAVWGLLPLLVRQELGLGPQAFGLMLGAMGAGAVTAGFLMPNLRGRLNRGQIVWAASALSALAMAVIAAVGLPAFIIWELGEENPIVDIRIFRYRGFTAGTIAVALGFGAFFASVVLTPLWLQQVVGYTASQAGYATAFVGVFAVLMSPVAAQLLSKVDARITVFGGIMWLGIMSLLRAGWSTESAFWQLAMPQLLQGFGMPFFFIGLTAIALAPVKPSEAISAAGIMSFVRTLCGAIGTAMATTAWDGASRVSRSDMVPSLNGVEPTMAALEARGFTPLQAQGVLDRLVDAQSATVGATHVFIYAFIVFMLAAAFVWLAPRPSRAVDMAEAH